MRNHIDLCRNGVRSQQPVLTEGRVERVELDNTLPFTVYIDPIEKQLNNTTDWRGGIATDGHLYLWDAFMATHHEVSEHLALSFEHEIHIRRIGERWEGEWSMDEEVWSNPMVLRAFPDLHRPVFESWGEWEEPRSPIIPAPKKSDIMAALKQHGMVRGVVIAGTLYIAESHLRTHYMMVQQIDQESYETRKFASVIFAYPSREALLHNDWEGGNFYSTPEDIGILGPDPLPQAVTALFRNVVNHGEHFLVDPDDYALTEAPISDINLLGDWDRASSFRHPNDRKLLQNPKAVAKIKTMWRYPEDIDVNILLINNADANLHFFYGTMTPDKLAQNFPRTVDEITPLLKTDQVNLLFCSNKGSPRHPLTGWMMAHRFGHVLMNRDHFYEEAERTLRRYLDMWMPQYGFTLSPYERFNWRFDTPTLKLMTAICTFRSAREGKVAVAGEALHELFAQYIITGRLKFNELPKSIKYKNTIYGHRNVEDYDHDNSMLDDLAEELQSYFETAIHYAVGKIYVI